ncbi:putative allantoate permease-1 [Coleophoma crateriformis]|uniref:Putative allantoate permease-1 n=1 Tax=Coleophoma crateriformis TaxID=565419 RepID=A0A3D8R2N8_9HELO|nr:putative allantoate permease-1 [Coleophoma crateriformis]
MADTMNKTTAADSKGALDASSKSDIETTHGIVNEIRIPDNLRWKIDRRLIPLLCFTYMLQSVDKSTLGYAAVFDLQKDAHLVGTEYSWLGAIFYLGYLFWEYPTNLLLQRFPVAKFMSGTVILWGLILMCHAACHDFASLAAVRIFLGTMEASINPGSMIIFTMWYKRSEQPLRMGIWIGSAGISYILGGAINYGVGNIQGSLSSWRIMFLLFGGITALWGVVLAFFLPDSLATAKFLTPAEREAAIARIAENGTGVENKTFKPEQFKEALLDIKTWLLFLFAFTSNCPNGGLTTFQGLIIKGMNFTTLRTILMQMPSGAVQAVACVMATWIASTIKNTRCLMMLLFLVPFLVGIVGLYTLPSSNPYGRLVCLWLSFSYTATWTLSMALATANTAGHTKKITTNAFLIMGYCLGNFCGPFFFKTAQAPGYVLGITMMFVCIVIQVVCIGGIWALLWFRNRKRSNAAPPLEEQIGGVAVENVVLLDQTDLGNLSFRVSSSYSCLALSFL